MPSSRIAYLTAIDFGAGAISGVGDAVRELGISKPLLVADKGIQAAGLVAKATASLGDVPLFLETPPNPTESAVKAALAQYREAGCDGIIALGGGRRSISPKAWRCSQRMRASSSNMR